MAQDEFGSVREYSQALATLEREGIPPKHRALLLAHYAAPEHSATNPELAKAVGYPDWRLVNRWYGAFAHRVALKLGISKAPTSHRFRGKWWGYVLEDFAGPSVGRDGHTRYVLRAPVVSALEGLGWGSKQPSAGTDLLQDLKELAEVPETERTALIQARLGMGPFRAKLEGIWQTCAVTGVEHRSALRASHIKPWRESTNKERLDPYNGLLLVASLDALFDAGLITFDDSGFLIPSADLSKADRRRLGIRPQMHLRKLSSRHRQYLAHHRNEVYRDS